MTKPIKPQKPKKPTRQQYAPDFRTEALALADRVGVPEAARQLGLESGLIYNWRKALRDRKSTRLNSSHIQKSRMPSSA